jgi:transglutaminase-like putative cysteine protease
MQPADDADNSRAGRVRRHLAVALCRANEHSGALLHWLYVGLPAPYAPMDFCAWFEAYLGNRWETFDPRNNAPRIGRILTAGRDVADVAISNTFGPAMLNRFMVLCEPDLRLAWNEILGRDARRSTAPREFGTPHAAALTGIRVVERLLL